MGITAEPFGKWTGACGELTVFLPDTAGCHLGSGSSVSGYSPITGGPWRDVVVPLCLPPVGPVISLMFVVFLPHWRSLCSVTPSLSSRALKGLSVIPHGNKEFDSLMLAPFFKEGKLPFPFPSADLSKDALPCNVLEKVGT